MHIEADRDVCIGAGNCVMVNEKLFDQDDDAVVVVLKQPEDDRETSSARSAVAQCPSGALRVVED